MTVVICPGIHESTLTDSFLQALAQQLENLGEDLVLPSNAYPPFSAFDVLRFLQQRLTKKDDRSRSLIFISFSAGVVGAIGAALAWQQGEGQVRALIALDGWGVPLFGNFPIHRLSHDHFTHWSSALLGGGEHSFYADPAAAHLDLWRSPAQVKGWMIQKQPDQGEVRSQTTAAAFLATLLKRYSE